MKKNITKMKNKDFDANSVLKYLKMDKIEIFKLLEEAKKELKYLESEARILRKTISQYNEIINYITTHEEQKNVNNNSIENNTMSKLY